MLNHLYERPEIRPAELADTIGLTRGAISKVLDKLENKKWITRKILEADNRGQALFLTQRGCAFFPNSEKLLIATTSASSTA